MKANRFSSKEYSWGLCTTCGFVGKVKQGSTFGTDNKNGSTFSCCVWDPWGAATTFGGVAFSLFNKAAFDNGLFILFVVFTAAEVAWLSSVFVFVFTLCCGAVTGENGTRIGESVTCPGWSLLPAFYTCTQNTRV